MTAYETPSTQPTLSRSLSMLDAVMILVGGVIGSGIFLTAGAVAESLRRPDLFILVWIVGGFISLLACLSVAELAGMYPHAGGQYIYLLPMCCSRLLSHSCMGRMISHIKFFSLSSAFRCSRL